MSEIIKNSVEEKISLIYKDGEKTEVFLEGENIICCLKDGKRYMGKIAHIGAYQSDENSETEQVIYIDMPMSQTSYSGEIVKVKDITYICKTSMNDMVGYPNIKEKKDKDTFIDMFVCLGYERERAEDIYNIIMKNIISLYNVPLSLVLTCVVQEIISKQTDKGQEELIYIIDRCMDIIARWFQSTTDIIKKTYMKAE